MLKRILGRLMDKLQDLVAPPATFPCPVCGQKFQVDINCNYLFVNPGEARATCRACSPRVPALNQAFWKKWHTHPDQPPGRQWCDDPECPRNPYRSN
jgi:hypothetical protein